MITAEIKYTGNLRTQSRHIKSGNEIITDAPTDNNGNGKAFSPTDLLSTSLVNCMITVMGIAAAKRNIRFENIQASMKKIMASNPRRVKTIKIEMVINEKWNEKERILLEQVALNCPVAKSLSGEIEQKVVFNYRN